MYCNKCGSRIEDGASVCPVCGAQVEEKVSFDWSGVSPGKPVKETNDLSSPWEDGAYAGSPEFADVLKREMAEKQRRSEQLERQATEKEPEPQDFSLFEQSNEPEAISAVENELAEILKGNEKDFSSDMNYDDTSESPFFSEGSIFGNDTSTLDLDDDDDFFVGGDDSSRDSGFDPFVDIDDSGRYSVPGEGEKEPFLPFDMSESIDEQEYENAKKILNEKVQGISTIEENSHINLERAQKAQEIAEAEAEKVAEETGYTGNLDETKNDIMELKNKLATLMNDDVPSPNSQPSDAVAISDLEKQIFNTESIEDAETKKIDKFYTLYRKNEEFQRLLDEEYEKLQQEEMQRGQGRPPQTDPQEKARQEAQAAAQQRQNHQEILAAQEEARRREQLLEQQRQEELMRQKQREMEIAKQRAQAANDDMDPYKDFSDLTPEKKKKGPKNPADRKGCRKLFSVLGVAFGIFVFLVVACVAIAIFSPNSTLGAVLSRWYETFTSLIS